MNPTDRGRQPVSGVTSSVGRETQQMEPPLRGSVYGTCKELRVEHVNRLVVPGILTLQVDGVQEVLDEGGQHHGEQDGVLGDRPTADSTFRHPCHHKLRVKDNPE